MPYDITAIVTCAAILAWILRDGRISTVETYFLVVCCFVLGATSWVTNFLHGTVFSLGVDPYVVCGALMILVIWRGSGGKGNAYILMVCALVLGSTTLVTSILPPLVNGLFAMIGALFTNGL